jgi:hypothetical protein
MKVGKGFRNILDEEGGTEVSLMESSEKIW